MTEDEIRDNSISMEQALEEFGEIRTLNPGQVLKGEIVNVGNDSILIDIGAKAEALLPITEAIMPLKPGDSIEVLLEHRRGPSGHPLVSQKKALIMKAWDKIVEKHRNKEIIQGTVTGKMKGGFRCSIEGVDAFLPGSHAGARNIRGRQNEELVGQVIPLRITEVNKQKNNVVVSHRMAVEEERRVLKDKTFEALKEGETITGTVTNITTFGAFVDIGGIDGLLHIKDISWGRIKNVKDVLKVGDTVQVMVLSFDKQKETVSLGLKQLTEHPWERVEEKYPSGSIITGRVTSITRYGAFIELEAGLEGMIHVSEMSWSGEVKDPKQILKAGDMVQAKVLNIEKKKQRMALGLKQIQPNPWLEIEQKYKPGSLVRGQVTHLVPFGAFIRLPEGVEGLIHVSDMSWIKKVKYPEKVLKKGEEVEAVVIQVSAKDEKISLGLKQKTSNPWARYPKGSTVSGTITRLTGYGAFVKLDEEIEGMIHISQVSVSKVKELSEAVKVGDTVSAKVIKIDEKERKIELSIREYIKDKEKKEIGKYINQQMPSTLGEIIAGEEEEEEEEGDE